MKTPSNSPKANQKPTSLPPERLDRLGRGRAAVLWIAHQRPDGIGRVAEPAEVLRHGRRPPSVMIVAPIVLDPGASAQDLPRYPR